MLAVIIWRAAPKENMYRMLYNTGLIYLKGLGVKDSTLWNLSGGDRSDESSSNG